MNERNIPSARPLLAALFAVAWLWGSVPVPAHAEVAHEDALRILDQFGTALEAGEPEAGDLLAAPTLRLLEQIGRLARTAAREKLSRENAITQVLVVLVRANLNHPGADRWSGRELFDALLASDGRDMIVGWSPEFQLGTPFQVDEHIEIPVLLAGRALDYGILVVAEAKELKIDFVPLLRSLDSELMDRLRAPGADFEAELQQLATDARGMSPDFDIWQPLGNPIADSPED